MQLKKAITKAKSFTAAEWFGFLFTTFAIILFAVAVMLNRFYYTTSLKSINADLVEDFRGAAEELKSVIKLRETEILQKDLSQLWTPDLDSNIESFTIIRMETNASSNYPAPYINNIGAMLASNKFDEARFVIEQSSTPAPPMPTTAATNRSDLVLVPSFLAYKFKTFQDSNKCIDAFAQALQSLESSNLSFVKKLFSVSAQIVPENKAQRIIAAWSHVYTLPKKKKIELSTLYYLLYVLFDAPGGALDNHTTDHIEAILKEKFSDYQQHKLRSREAWDLAKEIMNQTDLDGPPVRMVANGMIVSAIKSGKLFTFKIDWRKHLPNNPSIRLRRSRLSEESSMLEFPIDFLPGYVLSVSRTAFDVQSKAIRRQYLVTNTLLGVLLLLIVLFALGSVRLIREEKDLAQLRSRFVATVSHELRTPLSLIQLYSETLNEGRIDPKKRSGYLQTIVAETQRLTGLVNNVIDFSRLEIGTKKLNYSDSNISELAWNVIQEFKYRLNLEGFRINVHIYPDLKARIDPQAFCRILFNLLDNAIKYSEKEKYIALKLSRQDGNAVLEVTDHGIGIPVAARPFVYMDYYRVDDPRVASQRGSGIGLSVVKQLLNVMNASVEISNAEPTGTSFIVTIPTNREQDKESKES